MRVLLIDTCGEVGLIALSEISKSDGVTLFEETELPAREASRMLLDAIAALLDKPGWKLSELDAVCVVAGPGSFTGVRVGMAAAKGLCEATGLRLVLLSRLAVLANAGEGLCAMLDAGRGEFYVRTVDGREALASLEELSDLANGKPIVVCEQKAFDALAELQPAIKTMSLEFAVPLALDALQREPLDAALADANYVRREQDIYPKARA